MILSQVHKLHDIERVIVNDEFGRKWLWLEKLLHASKEFVLCRINKVYVNVLLRDCRTKS
jgi:hypothetical protein